MPACLIASSPLRPLPPDPLSHVSAAGTLATDASAMAGSSDSVVDAIIRCDFASISGGTFDGPASASLQYLPPALCENFWHFA